MRILYLTAPGDPSAIGGVQRYARDVGAAIAARGHEIRWVHPLAAGMLSALEWTDRIPRPRYWDRFYFLRRNWLQDYRFHQALERTVSRVCRTFQPDLVHSFFVYNVGALTARPIPVSVTAHGIELLAIPPVTRLLRRATGVHANSRFTAAVTRRLGAASTRVMPWGIRVASPALRDPDIDLITVSRLVQRKNVATVLKALAELPPLRYVVVGDGPELPALRRLAAELDLKSVEFTGAVDDATVDALYRRSRLFVMAPTATDDDFEGLGLVYFEAHGYGLPVVASNTGGVSDAVGDAGLLVDDPLDVAAVARTLAMALLPATLARLSERVTARQRTHSWDRFIDGFEQWHQEIAASRRDRAPWRPGRAPRPADRPEG